MGESFKTNIRTYRDSFQGIGCRTGCLVHLALLGVLGLALLIWAVKNRVWELEITLELPAHEQVEEAETALPSAKPAPQ